MKCPHPYDRLQATEEPGRVRCADCGLVHKCPHPYRTLEVSKGVPVKCGSCNEDLKEIQYPQAIPRTVSHHFGSMIH